MNWQMITFFTRGTGYEKEVEKLLGSANANKISLHQYSFESAGSWRQNLNFKSECIKKSMTDFPDKDIVFVDADAIIRSYPQLFDHLSTRPRQFDIAAQFFQWRRESKVELLSGTLWIANNDRGREIVDRWHKEGIEHPEKRHQQCLQDIVNGYLIYHLPFSYTAIFDAPQRKTIEPVIEHFQASRKYRNAISKRTINRLTTRGIQ